MAYHVGLYQNPARPKDYNTLANIPLHFAFELDKRQLAALNRPAKPAKKHKTAFSLA